MKLRLLVLATALSAQIPDFKPATPMLEAALRNDAAGVSKLLASGANPNTDRFFGFPVLTLAAVNSNTEMAKKLILAGADLEAPDANGNTALMWAADPKLMELLLSNGADISAKNKFGETSLTMAIKRGDMQAADRLKTAGASDATAIRAAVEKSIAALQKSGPQFVKVSGCSSCHHQSLPQMLTGAARKRGYAVDETVAAQQLKTVMAMFRPIREKLVDGSVTLPNPGISVSYSLLGLEAEGHVPDETTHAMTLAIARTQLADGSFAALPIRPPMEASAFTATALSIRALRVYGKDVDDKIANARAWLINAKPTTNEDKTMRLLGLVWSNAPQADIDNAADELLAAQRQDGGWAQLDGLETDAYATGQAMVALQLAGKQTSHGVAYLLRTQLADGTWHVRTRSSPFQPLKDSGFPHGRDQWISAAGTSWAGLALTLSQPEVD